MFVCRLCLMSFHRCYAPGCARTRQAAEPRVDSAVQNKCIQLSHLLVWRLVVGSHAYPAMTKVSTIKVRKERFCGVSLACRSLRRRSEWLPNTAQAGPKFSFGHWLSGCAASFTHGCNWPPLLEGTAWYFRRKAMYDAFQYCGHKMLCVVSCYKLSRVMPTIRHTSDALKNWSCHHVHFV